ncbi:MAG: Wzt carbohydrate-binding domain-containing protein, partial [Burkholderiales bacterium]
LIRRVQLIGDNGSPMVAFQGGEKVKLLIEAVARQDIFQPLLGFHLKDRLGQILFGDNTFVACQGSQIHVAAGQLFRAEFSLTMPYLGVGDYVISAAVGEGTQQDHVIHHWQQDALAIRSQTTVLHGLFAIPITPTLVIGE